MLLKWEKQSILHRETTGIVIYILSRLYEWIFLFLILYDRLLLACLSPWPSISPAETWVLYALQLSRHVISGCKSNIKIKSTSSQSDCVCFVVLLFCFTQSLSLSLPLAITWKMKWNINSITTKSNAFLWQEQENVASAHTLQEESITLPNLNETGIILRLIVCV